MHYILQGTIIVIVCGTTNLFVCFCLFCYYCVFLFIIANTGNSDELPINLVVIAIGSVAFVILIAIIIVAVLLLVFCVRFRKDNTEFTDFEPVSIII